MSEKTVPIKNEQTFNQRLNTDTYIDHPIQAHGLVDSSWTENTTHQESVSGIIIKYTGGTIFYNTKFQETIAISHTEAEFTAAYNAGESISYVRSILDQIRVSQDEATTFSINSVLLMGNVQQTTHCTRHMDMRQFAIQDWVGKD